MFSNAESQLIYKVANAPIRMYPYPHILVHDVFPADFYRTLPPPNAYKTLTSLGRVSGNYPDTRVVLPLTKPAVADLAEPYRGFWDDTSRWLLGGFFGQEAPATRGLDAGLVSSRAGPDRHDGDRLRISFGRRQRHLSEILTAIRTGTPPGMGQLYCPTDEK